MKDPEKNLPRSIIFGLLATTVIYLLINAIYLYYIPPTELKNTSLAAATMMERAIGSMGGKMVALMVLVSTFGALNGYVLTGGRLLFAIAEDHRLFKKLSHVHPQYHTPWIALSFNALIALIMIFTGTFDQILSFMMVAVWSLYLLVGSSVFVLRRKHPKLHRPYKIWGYPWIPIIFLASTSMFVLNILLKDTRQAVLGFLVAALGLPFYWLSKQIKK
jgi:amino acid transporter